MSAVAIIIYEFLYFLFYVGVLLSKSTWYKYIPNPSLSIKLIFFLFIFSGFFVPYFIRRLRIGLTRVHYLICLGIIAFLYCFFSSVYYTKTLRYGNFHSYTKNTPPELNVAIPKPLDVYRIICLGGSTTFLGNPSYPEILHEMLKGKYPNKKIEVLNAGMEAFSTQDAIIQYLFYLKETDPDLIIFFEAINDIFPSFLQPPFSSEPFRTDYGHFYGLIGNIRYPKTFEKFLSEFFFYDLLNPKPKPTTFSDFKSLPSYRRNLETLIEITRCKNIKLILSNQAHCFRYDTEKILFPSIQLNLLVDKNHFANTKSWFLAMELFNKTIREIAEKYNIPFVDQASILNNKPEMFYPYDTVHMTQEGLQIKAKLFYDKIIELKLLE